MENLFKMGNKKMLTEQSDRTPKSQVRINSDDSVRVHTHLSPLTADDLGYIRALAAEHSVGLEQRCARYRRRVSLRRTAVAACMFFGCCLSYSSSMAAPLYEQITTSGQSGVQHICDTIRLTIENV